MPPKTKVTSKSNISTDITSSLPAASSKKTSKKKVPSKKNPKSPAIVQQESPLSELTPIEDDPSPIPEKAALPKLDPPETPTPTGGRVLRKRKPPAPETPSKALSALSIASESPKKRAKTSESTSAPVPPLEPAFVPTPSKKKPANTAPHRPSSDQQASPVVVKVEPGLETVHGNLANVLPSTPVKKQPTKLVSPKKSATSSKAKRPVKAKTPKASKQSPDESFVVDDGATDPDGDYQLASDGEEAMPAPVAVDGQGTKDVEMAAPNSDMECEEIECDGDEDECEDDGDDEVDDDDDEDDEDEDDEDEGDEDEEDEDEGDEDEEDEDEGDEDEEDEEDEEDGEEDEEDEEEEPAVVSVSIPGAVYPTPPTDVGHILNVDILKDYETPEGFYPAEAPALRVVTSNTFGHEGSQHNILPSKIKLRIPGVDTQSLYNCLRFTSLANMANLSRMEVGIIGTRVYEGTKKEVVFKGRGTAICVTTGIVPKSHLRTPQSWEKDGVTRLYHSFSIHVLPLSWERQRLLAHLGMLFPEGNLRANMFNGSLVMQTGSAKINTPLPTSNSVGDDDFTAFAAGMASTANAGYGFLSPMSFRNRVPIYDATGIKDFVLENYVDNLAKKLPLYEKGEAEVPDRSIVTVGFLVRKSGQNSQGVDLLNFYIQWVILLGYPGMPYEKEQKPKKKKVAAKTGTSGTSSPAITDTAVATPVKKKKVKKVAAPN